MDSENPRDEIEKAVAAGNLPRLLAISGMLHGHFCPFSALGVKAGARAMKDLQATSAGMEELVAIVETNNCFSDGIQIVTGCTFGNNSLIYKDFGKTAFTLARPMGAMSLRISTWEFGCPEPASSTKGTVSWASPATFTSWMDGRIASVPAGSATSPVAAPESPV